jgi:YD repeat-containing protein
LDRLVNWSTANTNQSFGYDVVGNRTSQTIGASSYPYSYSALSNQLTDVAGPAPASYQYDPAGSIVSAGQASLTYDARHRLVQSAVGAQRASYQVNALGQRVMKTLSNGATTVYHYDLDGHLIAESDAVGNVQVEYIYLGEIPVALLQ